MENNSPKETPKERYVRVPVIPPRRGTAANHDPVQTKTTKLVKQPLPISAMTAEDVANAVVEGKHRYDLDQAIGASIFLGIILFPLLPITVFIGGPWLAHLICQRRSQRRSTF